MVQIWYRLAQASGKPTPFENPQKTCTIFMRNPTPIALSKNTILVIEDPATKQNYDSDPFPMGMALDIPCVCGARIHPIIGAWCTKCSAKVLQIREFSTGVDTHLPHEQLTRILVLSA
jgi:hypothetical protein